MLSKVSNLFRCHHVIFLRNLINLSLFPFLLAAFYWAQIPHKTDRSHHSQPPPNGKNQKSSWAVPTLAEHYMDIHRESKDVCCSLWLQIPSHSCSPSPYFLHENQYFPMSSKWIHPTPKRHFLNPLRRVKLGTAKLVQAINTDVTFSVSQPGAKKKSQIYPSLEDDFLGILPRLQPMLSWICLFKCYTFNQFTQIPMKQLKFFLIFTQEKITAGVTPVVLLLSPSSYPGQGESLCPPGICPSLCLWHGWQTTAQIAICHQLGWQSDSSPCLPPSQGSAPMGKDIFHMWSSDLSYFWALVAADKPSTNRTQLPSIDKCLSSFKCSILLTDGIYRSGTNKTL